jgi:twinkle protein
MIPESVIQKIKDAAVIDEVIGGFMKLKKEGKDYKGLCPFHNEKTPSFSISPSRNIYKCFGCGESGDSITFLMKHEKLTYIDAIKWVADRYHIDTEETSKKYVKPVPRLEKLSAKTLDWFENERKISNNTLLRFGITESKEWMPQFKQEASVICFNYINHGELINIKFRGPQKSFKMAKDAELIFYNLPAIENEDECYIVEGEVDCLSLYEAGIHNVVSVPNGASTGNQRLEYLDNCWQYFDNKKKIVLWTDNDEPGNKLKEELARRLGYNKCWYIDPIGGCKDANDVLVKHGKDALKSMALSAKEWPIIGLITMDDMFETVKDFYENGYPEGDRAGIGEFDDYLSFYPGQLTVVTGIPGSGKSEFVDWIMASLSKHKGWNWGVCSFENPPEFHVTKLAEKYTNKSFAFRKNMDQRISPREFDYAIGEIDRHFNFINLSMVDVTIDGLIKKAEELVKRKGINGLLFDPWNCIEHKYSGENETKYILECLNKLLIFLEKHRVHGFLVAHPTKLRKDPKTGKYEIPTLYNISGSAHFFNRPHNGLSIYRDFQTNIVDVYVQKVKWAWLGKVGFTSYNFDTMTRAYTPLVETPQPTNQKITSIKISESWVEPDEEAPF